MRMHAGPGVQLLSGSSIITTGAWSEIMKKMDKNRALVFYTDSKDLIFFKLISDARIMKGKLEPATVLSE